MTWIRCSDRMPMGEAIEFRRSPDRQPPMAALPLFGAHVCANEYVLECLFDHDEHWREHTEWRPLDEPFRGAKELPHAATTRRILAEIDAHPERFTEGMQRAYQEAVEGTEGNPSVGPSVTVAEREQDILRAALNHHGIREQLAMLQEECGELIAAINHWFRDRDDAFEAMIDEMADVSILIDQMRLVYGAEIDAARARKLARLRERLER